MWSQSLSDPTVAATEIVSPSLLSLSSLKVVHCPSQDDVSPLGSLPPTFSESTPAPAYKVPITPTAYAENTLGSASLYFSTAAANAGDNWVLSAVPKQPNTTYKSLPHSMTGVTDPANTVYFFEMEQAATSVTQLTTIGSTYIYNYTSYLTNTNNGLIKSANFAGRHFGQGNVAFMDGHVEIKKPYIPQDVPTSGTNTTALNGVPYLTLWNQYKFGFLTDDDHSEPWLTFAANATPANGVSAFKLFVLNKDTLDR